MKEPTAVYRFYDKGDILMYVGISRNPHQRFIQHHAKYWWDIVARYEIIWCDDRRTALWTEAAAILNEGPAYNRQRPPGAVDWTIPEEDGWWITNQSGFPCTSCGRVPSDIRASFCGDDDCEWVAEWECCHRFRVGVTEHRIRQIGHASQGWRPLGVVA